MPFWRSNSMSNAGETVPRVIYVILDSKLSFGEVLSLLTSYSLENPQVPPKTLWVIPSRDTPVEYWIRLSKKLEKILEKDFPSQSPTPSSATLDEQTKTSLPLRRKSILRRANHVCSNLSRSYNLRSSFDLATSRNLPQRN